jgi:hypothetical protein
MLTPRSPRVDPIATTDTPIRHPLDSTVATVLPPCRPPCRNRLDTMSTLCWHIVDTKLVPATQFCCTLPLLLAIQAPPKPTANCFAGLPTSTVTAPRCGGPMMARPTVANPAGNAVAKATFGKAAPVVAAAVSPVGCHQRGALQSRRRGLEHPYVHKAAPLAIASGADGGVQPPFNQKAVRPNNVPSRALHCCTLTVTSSGLTSDSSGWTCRSFARPKPVDGISMSILQEPLWSAKTGGVGPMACHCALHHIVDEGTPCPEQ